MPRSSARRPDLGVRRRRHRDRDRLHPIEQRVEIAGLGAQLAGDLAGAVMVDIGDPDQPGAVERGEVTRMMPAEGADSDHPDRQRRTHAGTPRSDDSTKSTNRSTSGSGGRSARARSSACDRLRSELKNSR